MVRIFVSRNLPSSASSSQGASTRGTRARTKSTSAFDCAVSPCRRAMLVTLGTPIHALSLSSQDFENPTSRMGSGDCLDFDAMATICGR